MNFVLFHKEISCILPRCYTTAATINRRRHHSGSHPCISLQSMWNATRSVHIWFWSIQIWSISSVSSNLRQLSTTATTNLRRIISITRPLMLNHRQTTASFSFFSLNDQKMLDLDINCRDVLDLTRNRQKMTTTCRNSSYLKPSGSYWHESTNLWAPTTDIYKLQWPTRIHHNLIH